MAVHIQRNKEGEHGNQTSRLATVCRRSPSGLRAAFASIRFFRRPTRRGSHMPARPSSLARTAWHAHPLGQTLTVTAGCGWAQPEGGSIQVEQLPLNGRRYTDLAALTSGVAKVIEGPVNGGSSPTNGNTGGNFAVNGARGDQNNFVLDGIQNNSNDNGDISFLSSPDAIAEFKIQTTNYSPEFGRSAGGVVNATTKSGTNAFHGDLFQFLRNDALDARGYFELAGQPKAPYKQNMFGGTFGGPIKKDKTFFFVDYQGNRIHQSNTYIYTIPTQTERVGNFADILDLRTQTGVDALNRPIYKGEIYDPATTRTINGSVVRDGFGFDPATRPAYSNGQHDSQRAHEPIGPERPRSVSKPHSK